LLAHSVEPDPAAEICFHRALDVARRQRLKSLELRAAMNLSRLWLRQGMRAEARQLPAAVYHWFTEGFETADWQEVRMLLAAGRVGVSREQSGADLLRNALQNSDANVELCFTLTLCSLYGSLARLFPAIECVGKSG
jgi:predicted ATPase